MLLFPTSWCKMNNYSDHLFTLNGSVPTFLPDRLRLPSGETRYVTNITLEEILACGYEGPVEVPSFCESECICWCCETKQFLVEKINLSFYESQADLIYRAQLTEIISNRDASVRSKLTQEAQTKYDLYYAKVLTLLLSKDLITNDQIPSLSLNFLDFEDDRTEYIKKELFSEKALRQMQYNYEYLGVVPYIDPNSDSIFSEAINNFSIPTSWTPSGSLTPAQIQAWDSIHNEDGSFID